MTVQLHIFTELTLMFDQPAYSVEEGGTVDVMVTLCGVITDDVMVSVMTVDGTAGAVLCDDGILVHFIPVWMRDLGWVCQQEGEDHSVCM